MAPKKIKLDWGNLKDGLAKQDKGPAKSIQTDARFYQPTFGEDGTSSSLIRFLPAPDGALPIAKIFRHRFKGFRGFFTNNCPTTIGRDCPVCAANRELWNTDPTTVKQRARVATYVCNIVVLRDPQKPENNGKVFLYKFGKKIYDKIMAAIEPPKNNLEEVQPVIVFDYYEGANFKLVLKQKKVGDRMMPSPDDSSFVSPSKLGTDEEIEKVHKSLMPLEEFTAPDQFKTFEELEERFNQVNGVAGGSAPKNVVSASSAETPTPQSAGASATAAVDAELAGDDQNDDDFITTLKAQAAGKGKAK